MYFSEETVLKAIDLLANVSHNFKKNSGNADLLSYYLILKKLKVTDTSWIGKDEAFQDNEAVLSAIWQLGGLFDESENPEKKCCLWISSFCKREEFEKETDKENGKSLNYFYNKATAFSGLPGRLKDTIDNTASDYLLDKGANYTFRIKSDVFNALRNNYSDKFPIVAVAIWVYRNSNFESRMTSEEIKNLFLNEFNLSRKEARELFELSNSIPLHYANQPINHEIIRKHLGIEDICIIKPNTKNIKYNFKPDIQNTNYLYGGMQMKNDCNKVHSLLKKYKQVILTGVPGTGKSHMIEELKSKYKIVKKIQFHQNYTYQDFIIGKTIEDGNIKQINGELLDFIDEVNSSESEKDYLLVIDEINRGNISSIFGETLFVLDRGNEIFIDEKKPLLIPDNLHILGTMNTSDRSIAIVDYAIRRRFFFVNLEPDYDLIDKHSKLEGKEVLGNFLKKINKKIIDYFENSDYILGHSYFLTQNEININDIYDILHFKIIPMIIEYAHGDRNSVSYIFTENLINSNSEELFSQIEQYIDEDKND